MAKKSEELIEKPVTAKRKANLKVSKKSSTKNKNVKAETINKKVSDSKVNKKITNSTTQEVELKTLSEDLVIETIVENVKEKKHTKRTIKNISVKKSSTKKEEPKINTKTISKKKIPSSKRGVILNPITENGPELIVAPKNNKRTLKLNLEPKKLDLSPTTVEKEEKINQNSAFFNRPSIFDKFNIDIINLEAEENNEAESITEEISQEEVSDSNTENNALILECENEFLGSEDTTIVESVTETLEASAIENTISDANMDLVAENKITENDTKLQTVESENTDEKIEESETKLFLDKNEAIELDAFEQLIEDDLMNKLIENELIESKDDETTYNDFNNSNESVSDFEELKEVADNIMEETIEEKNTSSNPIGKFFDSSIPSMTANVNNTFSKIKKSIFKSPIFKKFTFEEASLVNNNTQIENNFSNQGNNLTDIQKALDNFTPNNNNNNNNVPEMEIQAEPVMTIPVVETDTSTISSNFSSYDSNENSVVDYSNIITPSADSCYNLNDLDDLEEQEGYTFSNKLVDKLENFEENPESDTSKEIDYDKVSKEDLEKLKQDDYNDETFSIEAYFGIDNEKTEKSSKETSKVNSAENDVANSLETGDTSLSSDEFINKFLESNSETKTYSSSSNQEVIENNTQEIIDNNTKDVVENDNQEFVDNDNKEFEKTIQEKDLEISNLSKLIEKYSKTISSLSDRIANLENNTQSIEKNEIINPEVSEKTNNELDINDINIEDLDINLEDILDSGVEDEEPSLLETDSSSSEIDSNDSELVESLLSEALMSKSLDVNLKDELLSEVLSFEKNTVEEKFDENLLDDISSKDLEVETSDSQNESYENNTSDFLKIIDSLTKAITELEQTPDIKQEATPPANIDELPNELISTVTEEKAINILINKDDIFSISILNESYEIVTDFDGTSVISENIHISTPKNNFYVKVGNKYIEIHNKKDHFVLNTNFEDIEFANAINNIAFAKKNNKIELNIKEAFKLSSVNNKIELSMLNKAIADLSSNNAVSTNTEENSICDNKTLLISEETQKVYLPYTIEDVMRKLKNSDEYQSVQEVIDNEYTLPLSTFKMPIISRFKEAYRFMRVKEKSSVYAAVDLALELMFNSNLNPAVIRAAKDLKELNIYLDCLYENEVEKFDCFKIIYKVLPKIK